MAAAELMLLRSDRRCPATVGQRSGISGDDLEDVNCFASTLRLTGRYGQHPVGDNPQPMGFNRDPAASFIDLGVPLIVHAPNVKYQ